MFSSDVPIHASQCAASGAAVVLPRFGNLSHTTKFEADVPSRRSTATMPYWGNKSERTCSRFLASNYLLR